MSDFLQSMAAASRERADRLPDEPSGMDLRRPSFPLLLGAFDLIAEIKHRSPAEGDLSAPDADRAARALEYADGGAAAISVLTEPTRFGGDMAHLREVADAVAALRLPVMCKDFLVSRRQVLEARANGASGILLIATLLDGPQLKDMLDIALDHALFVLLESFDEADLERCRRLLRTHRYRDAAERSALLFGVNTRDLRTLEVDAGRLARLSASLPAGAIAVAESGLNEAPDAARAAGHGYRMALVGTALMRSSEPARLIASMLDAGRRRVAV